MITWKIKTFHSAEHGSAMTEFIIGLPVFIMIFSGMGALYQINHGGLAVRMEAHANLWENADMGAGKLIPGAAALDALGSWNALVQNGTSALGTYVDSGAKSKIPLSLIPGTRPASPCYTVSCALGGANNEYFSWHLLNDNALDGIINGNLSASGWASIISSGLTATGSRPAVAAGLRYGAVEGEAQTKQVELGRWGSYDLQPGKLDIPGITQPTHRTLAVALTRIEFAKDDFWNEQVPEFDSSFSIETSTRDKADECTEALDGYNACMGSGPAGETGNQAAERCKGQSPGSACEGIGGGNPLGSIEGDWCGGAAGCP